MTAKENNKETKLRIEPDLDQWLASQAAIADIPKTKYIMKLLEDHRSVKLHTDTQLSPKLSPVDASIYAEVAALKSRVAKLEQGIPKSTQTIPKTIPSFEVGQVITGQHSKLYNLLHNSQEVHQQKDKLHYYLSNKLGIIFYQYGRSKTGAVKYKVAHCFPGERVVLDTEGKFFTTAFTGESGWFTEKELAALAEPTVPTELVNDEIAIDALEVTSLSQNEPAVEQLAEVAAPLVEAATPAPPNRLAKGELLERFATKLNNPGQLNTLKGNLDSVGLPKLGKGWTAQHDPEGKTWVPEDTNDKTRAYWVELTLVVAS